MLAWIYKTIEESNNRREGEPRGIGAEEDGKVI